jgi:hypothetical protein
MISNLDPKRFDAQLIFGWYPSNEGESLEESLGNLVLRAGLGDSYGRYVTARVRSSLRRIGVEKFRRHYEIRKVSSALDLAMHELKFAFTRTDGELQLRLYVVLDQTRARVVGLCFREKRTVGTSDLVKSLQNQDIHEARLLAQKYWTSPHSTRESV